ncbi:MAG: hypothetical protein Q7J98_02980 [Kiritimatiellia bacterium]|nr:hypothetical protein [Kiritimatiellia bacterium]
MKINILFGVGILAIMTTTTGICQPHVPPSINFQGKITDTNGVPLGNLPGTDIDGQINIAFRIYDSPTGGTEVWGQTSIDVYVERGLFSVLLTNLNNSAFPTNSAVCRWLEVEVRDWGATNVLAPRKEIVSVPYAINADMVDSLHADEIVGRTYTGGAPIVIDTTARTISLNYSGDAFQLTNGTLGVIDKWVDEAGDTMTGDLIMAAGTKINGAGIIDSQAITDGTIIDDDINPDANIAGSKVVAATETARGTVELATDGESAASLAVQANDGRLKKVGANTINYVPRWDGSALVKGSIYDPDTGNIGIGTTNPAARLDVAGSANISGPLSVAGILSVTETNIIQVMGTNILTMWPHGNMVTNLNADMVDGYHAEDIVATATNRMEEKDPTVVSWVKDGESWTELKGQGMPAGFADGEDNGITSETDPQVDDNMANNSVPRWDGVKLAASGIYYDGSTLISDGRMHIQTGEDLFLNPWRGNTYVGYGGGPGNLFVDGNVGIGTPSPAAKLDVNGNALIRGNVGIGTTSPQAKVDSYSTSAANYYASAPDGAFSYGNFGYGFYITTH